MARFLCLLMVVLLYGYGDAFLLDPQCSVSSPCSCITEHNSREFSFIPDSLDDVAKFMCDNRALTSIAGHFVWTVQVRATTFHFENNQIEVIPMNVSQILNSNGNITDAMVVGLFLNNNRIKTIERGAFAGFQKLYLNLANNYLTTLDNGAFVRNATLYVDLRNNSLSTVPRDLVGTKVIGLRLEGNTISSLNGNTLFSINENTDKMFDLTLSFDYISSWPHELHLINRVVRLSLYDMPFSTLDSTAFHSFENFLANLTIVNSKLGSVPRGITGLTSLTVVSLQNNKNFDHTATTLFDTWTAPMASVTYLEISGSDPTAFPDVFRYFPNITNLDLSNNKIDFIDTKNLMATSLIDQLPCQVNSINFDNNQFTRIPSALSTLITCLTSLSMVSNKIATLEFFDLRYFQNITELYLQNNSLKYITPLFNAHLKVLRLDNTALTTLPVCLLNLEDLTNFGVNGVQIECSCPSLIHLKSWNTSALNTFDGVCEYSSTPLRSYIDSDLRSCPDDPGMSNIQI